MTRLQRWTRRINALSYRIHTGDREAFHDAVILITALVAALILLIWLPYVITRLIA